MDFLSDVPLAPALGVLALIDGLSIGTLLIPVFLLLAPRVRGGRVLIYLVTIAVFYLGVGILFTLGLVNLVDVAGDVLSSTPGRVARLVIGAGLLVGAFMIPTQSTQAKKRDARAREEREANPGVVTGVLSGLGGASPAHGIAASPDAAAASVPHPPGEAASATPAPQGGRLVRWRDRLLSEGTSPVSVMAIAIAAGVVEVATMVPYIVAMTMLADTDMTMPLRFGALAGYCGLMIAPALVLLVVRIVAAPLVKRPLERFAAWLERTAAENTALILGAVGFFVARSAATELGLFEALGRLF